MPAKIIRLLFVIIVLTFAASLAAAQQIQGEIRYADSGQPVIGALVNCNGTGGVSDQLTDRSGKFFFRVSPGRYTVHVRVPGFTGPDQSAELLDTRSSEYMFFRLRPDGNGPKPAGPASTVDASVPPEAQKEFDKGAEALNSDKKGGLEEGARHLEKAVSIYPKFLEAQLRLGTAYMDLQQWDKAEQALKRTLEIDPKAANAMFALGTLYLRQKKDDEAEKILLQGLQVEDRSFQGHLTLGLVYWDIGSKFKEEEKWRPYLEKSYEQARHALELNPQLAGGHLLKGKLMLHVGRDADAQAEFEAYLQIVPTGPLADQTRALVEKIKKALAEAPKQKP